MTQKKSPRGLSALAAKNFRLRTENSRLKKLVREGVSSVDTMTGLATRSRLEKVVDEHFGLLKRQERLRKRYLPHFSVIFIDFNKLKSINDRYGHSKGDQIVREFAGFLRERSRRYDVVSRWTGGDEFVIFAPNTTLVQARQLAAKFKRLLEKFIFLKEDLKMTLSASFGSASTSEGFDEREALIHSADMRMYAEKWEGRQRKKSARRKK